MAIDIKNIAAASFMPGLQNKGQLNGTALITGSLAPSPLAGGTSNLTGSFVISLPDTKVVSLLRVTLPNANGDLAAYWFPLMGTAELSDLTAHWRLIFYVLSNFSGREISFNFVNLSTSVTTTFTNFPINVYGHLYSYPWSQ